ncbi:hypothetical protein, partial [Mucilaginibacter flavidus]|uniref:hypothetical protein n=1 Tax=Mucilaginibacter flavidus TaxID=2949309 RepID=UPI0020922156
ASSCAASMQQKNRLFILKTHRNYPLMGIIDFFRTPMVTTPTRASASDFTQVMIREIRLNS